MFSNCFRRMSFLFCNNCLISREENRRRTFFMTSCSHVFCQTCNRKDFCELCGNACNVVEIDANIHPELANFFEVNGIKKEYQNMIKVHHFKENQIKLFVEHAKAYRKMYKSLKVNIEKMLKLKKTYKDGIKRERAIIHRLKDAYESKMITSSLFQLRSPQVLSLTPHS